MSAVAIGLYEIALDNVHAGRARVNGAAFRGDLLTRTGTCSSRYGAVIDRRTLRPVAGVSVELQGQVHTTGFDGWYRFDFGCPEEVQSGGTTLIHARHPDYDPAQQGVGRGVLWVNREDLLLTPR